MPGGDVIDVTRIVYTDENTGERRVQYDPSWRFETEPFLLSAEARSLATMSVEELVAAVSLEQPDLKETKSVSTYDVKVTLDDISRSYKAVILWLGVDETGMISLRFVDHIVQRLDDAAREPLVAVRDATAFFDETADRMMASHGGGRCPDPNCDTHIFTVAQPFFLSNSLGHLWGSHTSNGQLNTVCTCNRWCLNRCRTTLSTFSACTDSGASTTACHARKVDVALSSRFSELDPVSCAAGWACGIKACLFCACGVTANVQIAGNGVSFTFGAENIFNFQWTGGGTCRRCDQQ